MTQWLLVTLAAPLASFGEEAGNAQRGTADRPARSALLGLAGAALGIDRGDADAQQALTQSFRIATRTLSAGALLSDFHTYQSLPSAKGKPATRAAALARREDLVTSITRRDYRCDVMYHAAYKEQQPGGRYRLETLRDAFMQPIYAPYLGRHSCPLSRPLAPELVEAETVLDAFRLYHKDIVHQHAGGLVATEDRTDLSASNVAQRVHVRMDEPGDRVTWQFSTRREYLISDLGPELSKDRS